MQNEIKPGEGYRLLDPFEPVEPGDEYFSTPNKKWEASANFGGSQKQSDRFRYRRRERNEFELAVAVLIGNDSSTPNEPPHERGWRILNVSERLQPGDQFWSEQTTQFPQPKWLSLNVSLNGREQLDLVRYRRRVDVIDNCTELSLSTGVLRVDSDGEIGFVTNRAIVTLASNATEARKIAALISLYADDLDKRTNGNG
jgi:hypothetical protein